jgi:hypothetical protein
MNGWWCYAGDSYPAGKYPDISVHKIEYKDLIKSMKKKDDCVLVDLGWSSREIKEQGIFLFGHKKPRGGKLTHSQIDENNVLGYFRGTSPVKNVTDFH